MSATQMSLISDTPIARRKDPDTSKEAGRDISRSGRRAQQQLLIASAVSARPGQTSMELAKASAGGFDRWTAARRLPELEKVSTVKRGEPRPCHVTGKRSITWWPA